MKRFSHRRLRSREQESEVNPLEFIANLSDAMLILSVGFMLALVANWNIDISAMNSAHNATVSKEEAVVFDKKDIKESEETPEKLEGGDLEKLGTVYYDSATDKYYIMPKDSE